MDINQINKATRYSKDKDIPQDLRSLIKSLLTERDELLAGLQNVAILSESYRRAQKKWR